MRPATLPASTERDYDLENLVGVILVRSTRPENTGVFAEGAHAWLERNGWARHLRIHIDDATGDDTVTFVPGAHQSNPEIRMAFRELPGFDRVQHRLEHWLYELM